MTDVIRKVCLKTIKRSDLAILCDHRDIWIHIKCNDLDKLDYEMLKGTADPWFLFLALCKFYLSGKAKEKAKETIVTPTNLFQTP